METERKKYVLTTAYQAYCARKRARYRALGIACYLGFAPLFWLVGIERTQNEYLQHHYRYSLFISLLLFFIVITTAIAEGLGYAITTALWNPSPNELKSAFWLERLFDYGGSLMLFLWVLAWTIGIVGAWRERMPRFPLLSNLTHQPAWKNFALGWSVSLRIGLLLLAFVAGHGVLLTRGPADAPQVYILYTNGGYIPTESLWASYTPPRWTFSLFFYPIVTAAVRRWGPGSVAIQPLSEATFRNAIRNGRFIFVASHGGREPGNFSYSFEPYKEVSPASLRPGESGEQLGFVYFAACYAGYREAEWKHALSPAEVMTYARVSYVEEHFIWVWTKGAKTIAALK
ncbi:MAG: hypothetical protein Fur0043_20420 [Anaerolineales bacterium]